MIKCKTCPRIRKRVCPIDGSCDACHKLHRISINLKVETPSQCPHCGSTIYALMDAFDTTACLECGCTWRLMRILVNKGKCGSQEKVYVDDERQLSEAEMLERL